MGWLMTKEKLIDTIGQFTTVPNSVIKMWGQIGLDAFALFVYLRYKTNSESGVAFPSYRDIQENTRLTRSRISAAISVLENASLLERKRRFDASTLYVIKMPPISASSQDLGLMPSSQDLGLPVVRTSDTINTDSIKTDSNIFSIAEALAVVCHMDLEANKGQLLREARLLKKATPVPTVELLKAHYNGNPNGFWKTKDWRGQKGQLPKPANIRETWGQWDTAKIDAPPPADFGPDFHPERPELELVGGSLYNKEAAAARKASMK